MPKFTPPTLEEVQEYVDEMGYGIDPEHFLDVNEANGWVQGKCCKPIKSWKATVRTWERNRKKWAKQDNQDFISMATSRDWAQ